MKRQTTRSMGAGPLGVVLAAALLVAFAVSPAVAQELLTNGDFETGDLTGWTVMDSGIGTFGISAPGALSPISGFPTSPNAGGGTSYAVSDQNGPGTHALIQTFTVPGPAALVVLRFEMFVNDQSGLGPLVNPAGLDDTAFPNQHARVDILTAAATPFDTGPSVLANFYMGVDPGPTPNPYIPYVFDITAAVGAGGTYQLRFAEVDNQLFLQQGVDNVSIEFTPAAPTMGTWAAALLALLLLLAGLTAIGYRSRGESAGA